MHARQQLDQDHLQRVGVLELVDQHVVEALGVLHPRDLVLLEQVHGPQDQVVEVQSPAARQPLLVARVDGGVLLVDERPGLRQGRHRVDIVVLPAADHRAGAAGRELLGVDLEVVQDLLEQLLAVVGVEDREVVRHARGHAVGAQDAQAGRVEGADPVGRAPLAHALGHALSHLAGRAVGEREGQDAARMHAAVGQQPGDAGGQHAGLAGARAGHDQDRAVRGGDGAALGVVQLAQDVFHGASAPAVRVSTRSGISGRDCRWRRPGSRRCGGAAPTAAAGAG